jgi:hypothetical protein
MNSLGPSWPFYRSKKNMLELTLLQLAATKWKNHHLKKRKEARLTGWCYGLEDVIDIEKKVLARKEESHNNERLPKRLFSSRGDITTKRTFSPIYC